VTIEGDDRRHCAELVGASAEMVDHRTVPEVDAVVGADRDDRPSTGEGDRVE
jgi:hypothetical protein